VGGLFAQGADGGPPVLVQVMPLILLGVVFYLLLVRPEQKRRREHEQLVGTLKRNDQVVMASGIHGRVTGLGEKVVTVEIAPRVQVQVDRTAIQNVEKSAGGDVREKQQPQQQEKS
jgi:preprotein translocase subunit YajC